MKKYHAGPDRKRIARLYGRRYRQSSAGSKEGKPENLPSRTSDPPCSEPCFTEIVERDLFTSREACYCDPIDLSRIRAYSFLVVNSGPNPVVVQPELSPDMEIWGAFGELPYIVEPDGKRIFVLQCFLRYARIKYRSWRPGHDTIITIWFQGQS